MTTLKIKKKSRLFSGFLISFLFGLLSIFILCSTVWAQSQSLSVTDQGLITIEADNLELKDIISEFENQHSLIFTGLSDFMDKKITLSNTGTSMDVIKKIFKLLNIENSAYIFNGEHLTKVMVLPSPMPFDAVKNSLDPVTETGKKTAADKVSSSTVQIIKVLPDSQGELVQLEKGDYIVAYNGHKISNAGQLVDYVKKYRKEDSVVIAVVRDQNILELTLSGGVIGVQIVTARMNVEFLESYYRDLGI